MMTTRSTSLRARLAFARVNEVIGGAGWIGLALLAGALFIAGTLRLQAPMTAGQTAPVLRTAPPVASPAPAPQHRLTLLTLADTSNVLSRIERLALASGVGWAAADYKMIAATESTPASLEVHCRLKAPYPKLRAMIATALADIPGLTLRDLSFTRPSSTAADLDARLVLAILLSDAPTAQEGRRTP